MGLVLFAHSVRLVFGNMAAALRISGLLYIAQVALFASVGLLGPPSTHPAQLSWPMAAVVLLSWPIFIWIAVAWHRFILLDETPQFVLPAFRSDRMLPYFGYFLLLGLISVAAALGLGFVAGVFVFLFRELAVLAIGGFLAAMLVGVYIGYRLAPVLPAAAIGQRTSIGVAWATTKGGNGAILVLTIVSSIAGIAIDLPAYLLAMLPLGGALVTAWMAVTAWVKLMVGVSILTTIYGHYVEGRPIDGRNRRLPNAV